MMARLSLLKLLLALAVLAVALAQRVVTTTTVRAGTTYVEVLSTDVDGSITTETLSEIAPTTSAATTSALTTSARTTSAPLVTSTEEDITSSTTTSALLTSTTSSSRSSSSSSSTTEDDVTSTSTTTRRPPPVGPTAGVDVPAGTIMDVGDYSSVVGARYSSRLDEYTRTGGAAPTFVNGNGTSTGSHNEVSAMFVAAGLVAAVLL